MQRRFSLLFIGLILIFAGCSQSPEEPVPFEEPDAHQSDAHNTEASLYDFESAAPWFPCPEEPFSEDVVEVEALSQVHQYFGDEDRRTVEEDVEFPDGPWAQVAMIFELECPEGGVCDHWDRAGSLQLVINPDAPAEEHEQVELLRHITPYRTGMCNYIDLTPLAGILTGQKALRSFIDTWVGPGHDQGEGWLVSATFVFTPGEPQSAADDIINVWSRRSIQVGSLEAGENVDSQIQPFDFSLPEEFRRVEAHLTTTGHSFGNTFNCAEFCQMHYDLLINDQPFSINPWRGDCAENPVSPQAGTWEHNRNGWCPGAVAVGHKIDITDAVEAGENSLDFEILLNNSQEYDNSDPVDLLPYSLVALKLYVYH